MLQLDTLKPGILQPEYARDKLRTRIAHIGFGAFHKAHQAVCAEALARAHASDWGYCEISLFSSAQIDSIRQQQNLWSVSQISDAGWQTEVVGIATQALSVPADGIESILEALSTADIAIVSLTITEKGYCFHPATNTLLTDNELIAHDIAHPTAPRSAPGVILEAIKRRRQQGHPPFSVMPCDNMPNNGHVAKHAILQLASHQDPTLAQWINDTVSFPSTMVDRIVPAVTDDTRQQVAQRLGVEDPAAVVCEPFFQWVIEDNFTNGRPAWEKAGATLVEDVKPYEQMKLRMLNGSHSFLAYLGYLAGHEHISDCMADPVFVKATRRLMLTEQAPTLSVPDIDLEQYADSLIQRFSNSALKHRTWQIAMDGSQKLPQRMLESISWHIEHQSRFDLLALGVAGWMHYVAGTDESGHAIDVRDPAITNIEAALSAAESSGASDTHPQPQVSALLALDFIFGDQLPRNPTFTQAITTAWQAIKHNGVRQAIREIST